jgi:hypothetical protein
MAAEDRPVLSLPLTCVPRQTCFIQTYVDRDPGPGFRDYGCGTATYDRHSGVDFRVLSAEAAKAGVPVLAAVDGTVKALRDGVPDEFFKPAESEDVAGRECGNGVILDHGDQWETQYCHMRKGSIRVRKGQAVKRGEQIGDVGFSGMANFAHVHLSVRHNGKIIDPFLPDDVAGGCVNDPKGPGLWEPATAASFPYRNGELLTAEFAGAPPSAEALEINHRDVEPLTPTSQGLVLYGRFINLRKGDRVHFSASGQEGDVFEETTAPLKQNMATYVAFTGKRRAERPWAVVINEFRLQLLRGVGVFATNLASYDLK